MFLTNTQNQTFNNTILFVLYGGLILFFIYKNIKTFQAQKLAEGKQYKFKKNFSKLMIVLMVLLFVFSIWSIFQAQYMNGIVMIALLTVILIENLTPNIFAENGFVADAKFIHWKEVKKWVFDKERGEIVISYKQGYENKNAFMRVKPEQLEEITNIFRKYKLNK